MTRKQAMLHKLATMPLLNHKPIEDEVFDIEHSAVVKWLVAQPEVKDWMFDEIRRTGAIRFNHDTREWWPAARVVVGDPAFAARHAPGQMKTLTVADVVKVCGVDPTKCAEIVAELRGRFKVSRRTVMTRLAEARAKRLLERTTPAGSYRLPAAEDID